MDVLIALLERGVNLKKDNQVGLMQGIQIFLKNFHTKKKAYKLMARLVERFELGNIGEEKIADP